MSRFAVMVFPDETKAYEGVRVVQELHRDAVVTVHGAVVVHRDRRGPLSVDWRAGELPLGVGVVAVVGGLVTLFGGAGDAGAIAPAGGGLLAGRPDCVHAQVSDEFLAGVVRELVPGTSAIAAEMSEDSLGPVNTRVAALGGRVVRESREDFVYDLLETRANLRRAELAARRAERSAKNTGTRSELVRAVGSARERLERAAAEIHERVEYAKDELQATLWILEAQAADASSEARARIARRIAALREEFGHRERRLARAYRLAEAASDPQSAIDGVSR